MHRAARSEQLAAWAVIDIPCRIKAEVGTREGAVLPVRPVKHRDMWCDALLFDKPVQHRSRTVSGIARKPFRLETKALLCLIMVLAAPTSAWRMERDASPSTMTPNFTS